VLNFDYILDFDYKFWYNYFSKEKYINTIYIIENTINNKIYIGSTKNFNKRKVRHFSTLKTEKHHNLYLQRAYNKYGKENFRMYTLEEGVADLFTAEQFWIGELTPEYNIGSVGGGDNLTNHPNRDDIIAARTATVLSNNAKLNTEERSIRWGKFGPDNPNWKGGISKSYCSCGSEKALTATTCAKCRDRAGVNNPFYGKKHSEETKRKISESAKGRIPSNAKQVFAEGTIYPSATEAGRRYGITVSAMAYRVKAASKKWEEFYYLIE
jgi:group I intron endonuclease